MFMLRSFFLFFSRYDPTTRPWYYAAKSYPGKVTFSVPYLVSNIQEFTKNKQRRLRRTCVTKIVPRNYYLNILLDLHFSFYVFRTMVGQELWLQQVKLSAAIQW